jgi:tetratricopeptide (TPR) repeat protein
MVIVHAHPGLVAVRAGKPDKAGRREFSSGLLIAPGLVLTARHGVTAGGGVLPDIEVSLATGMRGAARLSEPIPGTAAWLGKGGLDAALIELDDAAVPPGFLPGGLIWTEPAGTQPVAVTVTGMPSFAAEATGEQSEAETARGTLEPGTYAASDRYAVTVDAWPRNWQDWQGISGSPVICAGGGYLVGVTAWSDKPFDGRRLTAVPVRALLADPGFREIIERHLRRVPEVEPTELAPLLSRGRAAGTPGALLRADAWLTDFAGRVDELARLERGRDEPAADGPDVKALLITGRGGEGKTRLALEFLSRSNRDDWTGGVLRQNVSPDEAGLATHPGRPLLLVIDYAAARAPGIAALAKAIVRARPSHPVRLLLLARTKGTDDQGWWSDLAADLDEDLPGLSRQVLALSPLLATGTGDTDPAALFASTARALAKDAARFTGRTAAEMTEIAARLPMPALTGPRSRHVLTVQMAALAALLDAAAPHADLSLADSAERVEDALLRHEQRYRNQLATRRNLDDLRLVRDRAVVGAALFGARGPTEPDARQAACALVTAALPELGNKDSRQRDVAAWVADLYPVGDSEPGGDSEYWGPVLPDRLGEFLTIRLLANEETTTGGHAGLLASLTSQSDPTGIARALLVLSRAAAHDQRASAWISRLVASDPLRAGVSALQVAAYSENPAPLRAALVNLGQSESNRFLAIVSTVHHAMPAFSLRSFEFNASLSRELVAVYRMLSEHDASAWLPSLAGSLHNLAVRLGQGGQRTSALSSSEEAVTVFRDLARRDRVTYLPELARSLSNHSGRLAENGRHVDALAVSEEAVAFNRELEGRDRDTHLPDLANSLSNHANRLAENDRPIDALSVSEEAVAHRRGLAADDPDTYMRDLGLALNNHSIRLAENGRHLEALATSQEALDLRRELADEDPDTHLPDLATSLSNHANRLAENDMYIDALSVSDEALTRRRELVARNREAYLPV